MAEPASSIAAGGAAIKFGIVSGVGAVVAAVVVMAMTLPKTRKEWLAGLLSTVAGSIFGGAFLIQQYGIADWINQGFFGISSVAGILFASGLPAWVIVRAFFRYAESNKGKGLLEMIKEGRAAWKGE